MALPEGEPKYERKKKALVFDEGRSGICLPLSDCQSPSTMADVSSTCETFQDARQCHGSRGCARGIASYASRLLSLVL